MRVSGLPWSESSGKRTHRSIDRHVSSHQLTRVGHARGSRCDKVCREEKEDGLKGLKAHDEDLSLKVLRCCLKGEMLDSDLSKSSKEGDLG